MLEITAVTLESENQKKDLFVENLRKLFSGEEGAYNEVENPTGIPLDNAAISSATKEITNPVDSKYRQEFEQEGLNLSLVSRAPDPELREAAEG